jgi:hypothetical protein
MFQRCRKDGKTAEGLPDTAFPESSGPSFGRLRCYLWKQWGWRGYRELKRLGVSGDLAWNTAKSAHGPWRLSQSPALSIALPAGYSEAGPAGGWRTDKETDSINRGGALRDAPLSRLDGGRRQTQ